MARGRTPLQHPSHSTSVRLTHNTYAAAAVAAERECRTISNLIEYALRLYLFPTQKEAQ